MAEFSDYVDARNASNFLGGAKIPGSQNGSAFSFSADILNPNRGDYAGGTTFPASGGRYSVDGTPMRGDRWRLTDTLTIGEDIYFSGTILEAATDDPGQTTGNWIKYATQA